MHEETGTPDQEGILRGLRGLRGATTLQLPAGQVLLYRHQRPPGVFVILTGELEAMPERGRSEPLPDRVTGSPGRPVVFPMPERLESPSEETWAVVATVGALYLPLTLVRESAPLRARLEQVAHQPAS